uniref:Uncharacterized protein n=1 Tax=Anopheles minimus TaxID=112268 RepID=A0A182VUN9_9DIPT
MKFLTRIFLFAVVVLVSLMEPGRVSAKPPPDEIEVYEQLCIRHGFDKDCWITVRPPTTKSYVRLGSQKW